ncbi:MAG TPA: polysaccharide biosynthesis/export family protein [Candidatus Krumholzibacteria bacterium]|nr:polysaccharide biosynthesis/export family protein [Candidatus Krumholzibacteria bacterium]
MPFGRSTAPVRWLVAGTFLMGAVMSTACSSGIKGSSRAEGWYDRGSVQQFVTETQNVVPPPVDTQYVIGVGDLLEVVFPYHTNLTERDLVVRRDGRISLPYVGDQMAAGITPMDLDSVLTVRFSDILKDPNLSVIVQKPAPQRAYVLGNVDHPGEVKFEDEMSMVQAVASCGGFKAGALPNHAILIRRQSVSKIVGVEVDLRAVTNGAVLSNDLRLRNYDIVFIPQHPIFTAAEFMQAVGDIINVPLDVVFKGWQIANLSATYEYFKNNHPVQQP